MSRISALRRRDWTEGSDAIAEELSRELRTPYGTQTLRPIQAVSLLEAAECRGLFCSARVGAGKTLIAALLPTVLGAKRPLMLVPGSRHGQRRPSPTEIALDKLRQHWQVPSWYRIESFSKLSMMHHATMLDDYAPDLIVVDEAHKLKHLEKSVAARRLARYLAANPTPTAFLSGTITRDSILDYAHMLVWALGDGAPIPKDRSLQETWAAALDVSPAQRLDDLTHLTADLGLCDDVHDARARFRDRLFVTPGVVISVDSFDGPLTTAPIVLEPPQNLATPFANLRTMWLAPDGWDMADARFEVWGCAREMLLGFYYRHDPWPPEEWFGARRRWCKIVRDVIEATDLDSHAQVASAADAGLLGKDVELAYLAWKDIEPMFTINRVATWLSDHAVKAAAHWGERGGIVWVEHIAFGRKLRELTGWAYFGEGGYDDRGRHIESVRDRTIIASIKACGTGANLQHQWHRNLVTAPMTGAEEWEQVIGRTHREGQEQAVHVDYFVAGYEHLTAISQSTKRAEYTTETFGQPQKILDSPLDSPMINSSHPAWDRTQGSKD